MEFKQDKDEIKISQWTKEQCIEWLNGIGVRHTGTKEELLARIAKYQKFPSLVKKLKHRANRQYNFVTALNVNDIPPNTVLWKNDNYPKVTKAMFEKYCCQKRQGSLGQQEKAHRLFVSRKIVSVKVYVEGQVTFVKAQIRKSYGNVSRPAVLKFQSGLPQKGHCSCPVGLSGVCCHVISILYFLEYYHLYKVKVLALTCTEQLQKWHRKGQKGKGSLPMLPVQKLVHIPSAKLKKRKKASGTNSKDHLLLENVEKSTIKRNIEENINDYMNVFKNIGLLSIEKHFHDIPKTSDIGIKTSLGLHLCYKYEQISCQAIAIEHNYCKEMEDADTVLLGNRPVPPQAESNVKGNCKQCECEAHPKIFNDFVPDFKDIKEQIESQWKHHNDLSKFPTEIYLNLQGKQATSPQGINYHSVEQNTDAWKELRKGLITASKVPYLIGLHGEDKFNKYWYCIKNNVNESVIFPSKFRNFERGHIYEQKAVTFFEKDSGSVACRCGFFTHPEDTKYGASPDAVCPGPILLEIKTRAENSKGPLEKIKGEHLLQAQLQMACTGFHYVIIESFHPETNQASYFIVRKDELLLSVIKLTMDSILKDEPIQSWSFHETPFLHSLGEDIFGAIPTFILLKSLRKYVNKVAKASPHVHFKK